MDEIIETGTDEAVAKDPGNAEPAEWTAPLDDDDDAVQRIALVDTEAPEELEEVPGEPE